MWEITTLTCINSMKDVFTSKAAVLVVLTVLVVRSFS